jgi:pilus assembly protein CpaB
MKSKAMIPLILGGVVGLLAIKFATDAIRRAQGTPTETVKTVVARVDIPASFEITAEMVDVVETPRSPLVPDGAFTDAEGLVGRVTSKAIPQGAVIAPLSLAPPGTASGLTERIPEGHRAVSVKIDEVSGVAGQVKTGDFVDVIVVMRVKRGRQDETISRIILQRVKVLAVGRSLDDTTSAGPQQMARSVTLLVANTDVPKLHLAQTQGKVALAMRGADDRLMAPEEGLVSTAEWEEEQPQTRTPYAHVASPTAPGEQIASAQGGQNPPTNAQFTVTVFNGPLQAPGTAPVQQVTYENPNSLNVVGISTGRTGEGSTGSPDSAEGILRHSRRTRQADGEDRASERGDQGPGGYDEPEDREIAGE